MSKIKKYTIDQEIPKNIKASNLLRTVLHTGSGLVEFYFLVEEENVPRMRETNPYSYHLKRFGW